MKYLIKARLKHRMQDELMAAIASGTLGTGSVAFGEYIKNMRQARVCDDGTICWVEVCFCKTPLHEEMPYWEKYFADIRVENAQDPKDCQDENGESKRACLDCSCTEELEL
jgi:hypothetical protein